ncbi:hypothetical protein IFO69_02315 [Echinicola sp. CAU 1574]|uniref:Tetratricopeptide repeat protein n=1 Tax=Echinicola arenosa TaxID=2774144 RepID=A0ABR9AFG4_9BACT|nr:hypothetical protein [Echinicola arenosa]MBD8487572.1 hypothetical protein [Echinicola arenosa]
MNAAQLLSLIKNSNSLSKEDFRALIKLHETFPYFLVPKVLAAKYEQKISNGESKELLHWAAVQSPDRSWLKSLIEEDISFVSLKDITLEKSPANLKSETQPKKEESQAIPQAEKQAEVPEEITSRAEVLKRLEENLTKLRKQEEKPLSKTEEKTASTKPTSEEGKANPNTKNPPRLSTRRKKMGDDLIETIKKKEKKVIKDAKKKEQIDIIKAFSKKEIKLATIKENEDIAKLQDLSVQSTQLNDNLLSESYAKLLVKQGKKDKAVEIYRKLSLKFPKKKTYFADLIKELKD